MIWIILDPCPDQRIQLWFTGRVPELGSPNGREHGDPSYALLKMHLTTTRVWMCHWLGLPQLKALTWPAIMRVAFDPRTPSMCSFMRGMSRCNYDEQGAEFIKRNLPQVANLRSIDAPVLLDIIQRALPEGWIALCCHYFSDVVLKQFEETCFTIFRSFSTHHGAHRWGFWGSLDSRSLHWPA